MQTYLRKRRTEDRILRVLREAEVAGAVIREDCRKHHIIEQALFRWRNKFGDMMVSDVRQLKQLGSENAHLKKRVVDAGEGRLAGDCCDRVGPRQSGVSCGARAGVRGATVKMPVQTGVS
ncbi:transposase [Oxalobacteraceae bacterium OM1]|nr:transposase [Oxalobacteraceae bacterium OM1]